MNDMISQGPILPKVLTLAGALRQQSINEDLFVQGKSFSYEDYHIMGASGTLTFVFDPTAFTGINIVLEPFTFCSTAGPVTIDIYAGTNADNDGTLLGVSNRRATSSNLNQAIIRLDPTINNIGTRFAGDLVPATGTAPATSSPSSNKPGLPFELDPTFKYALIATNLDGAGVHFCIKITWFEV